MNFRAAPPGPAIELGSHADRGKKSVIITDLQFTIFVLEFSNYVPSGIDSPRSARL